MPVNDPAEAAGGRSVGSRWSRILWRTGWFALLLVSACLTYGIVVIGGR